MSAQFVLAVRKLAVCAKVAAARVAPAGAKDRLVAQVLLHRFAYSLFRDTSEWYWIELSATRSVHEEFAEV
jgi:hypothetical protein